MPYVHSLLTLKRSARLALFRITLHLHFEILASLELFDLHLAVVELSFRKAVRSQVFKTRCCN